MSRRILAFLGSALAAWSHCTLLAAGGASQDARLGDEAMRYSDYASASAYYARALTAAAGEERARLLLKQIEAELGCRRVAEARKLYTGWQMQYPNRSAGILPGRLLAAEGHPGEAAEVLMREAGRTTSPEQRSETLLAAAAILLESGEGGKALPMLKRLEEAPDTPHFFRSIARSYRVRALLQSGALQEAEKLFHASPYEEDYPLDHRKTELRIALARRDLKAFMTGWKKLPPPPRQDNDLARLASEAASLIHDKSPASEIDSAQKLLEEAVRSAANAAAVRECLRRKINFEEKYRPALAVETILQNLQEFDSAAERWTLSRKAALLMQKLGLHEKALELYCQLEADAGLSPLNRRIAAREGAGAARRFGQKNAEERLLQSALALTEQISTPGGTQMAEARCELGEFYLRTGKLAEAEKLFAEASAVAGVRQQQAEGLLLRTLIREEKYQQSLPLAEKLLKSEVPEVRDRAGYLQAVALDRLGRFADALSAGQRLLHDSPNAADAPATRLLLAEIEMSLLHFSEAQEAFLRFAADHPETAEAPAALFGAVRASVLMKDGSGSRKAVALLEERYPRSAALIEAHLMLAGEYTAARALDKAAAELAAVESVKTPEYRAEYLYRKAELLRKKGENRAAMNLFHEVSQNHPGSVFAADAGFQEGDLLFSEQRYEEAITAYERARKRNGIGVFPLLCRGHVAECRYYLAEASGNPAALKHAIGEFEQLARESSAPAVQLRSLMRLMLCAKQRRDLQNVRKYGESLLYLARDIQRGGITPERAEVRRAFDELMGLAKQQSAAARMRHYLYRYSEMQLETPEEMKDLWRSWLGQEIPNQRSL